MNNEPVAWLVDNQAYTIKEAAESLSRILESPAIPLYTRPVKEQDTDCKYCKQGCIRCDVRKQLTDEEIEGIARANVDGHASMEQLKWFARALLRKAQEK